VALPELHRAMQGNPVPEQIGQWMVDVSGLPVSLIGQLYRMGPVPAPALPMQATLYDDDTAMGGGWSAGQ
jgi:hypothetical protein